MVNFSEEQPQLPNAEDIQLTSENEELRLQLLEGVRGILTSDFVHTYEATDFEGSQNTSSSNSRYIARTAFMALDASSSDLDDAAFVSRKAGDGAQLRLAVTVSGHNLDIEKTKNSSPEKVQGLDFVFSDSVSLVLLDDTLSNYHKFSIAWQPYLRQPVFEPWGCAYGFESGQSSDTENVVHQALGIGKIGQGISPGEFTRNDVLRAINLVLNHGSPDMVATNEFIEGAKESATTEIVTFDPVIIRNSNPYIMRIIENALASPKVRDSIAWQQYWEQRGPMLTRQ